MSPTLLEAVIAVLLLVLAWLIGIWIAPVVFAFFRASWRDRNPPAEPDRWPPEKNVTPPPGSPRRHKPIDP